MFRMVEISTTSRAIEWYKYDVIVKICSECTLVKVYIYMCSERTPIGCTYSMWSILRLK